MTTATVPGQERLMANCMYCDQPEFGPNVPEPLCRKHLELRAIIWVLQRTGRAATPQAIRDYLSLLSDPVEIEPEDVAPLLLQMQRKPKRSKTHS